MDTHADAHIPVNSQTRTNACAYVSMNTPTHMLPVGLFYHIIIAGRGSLALCCSPKSACYVSQEKMR